MPKKPDRAQRRWLRGEILSDWNLRYNPRPLATVDIDPRSASTTVTSKSMFIFDICSQMGPGDLAGFGSFWFHQGPSHEFGDIPRIVMFVQAVDYDLVKSLEYTADQQWYFGATPAQKAFKYNDVPMYL
jgi:hypothetical protein